MFDPKRFDPLSPSLRYLLDQQEKRDRMLPIDRLSERNAWMTKFSSPLFQATLAPSPIIGMLANMQKSQGSFMRSAMGSSVLADMARFIPRVSQAEGPHRMLERLLTTPLASAMQQGGVKNLSSINRIVPAEQFMLGRLAWANDFTPHAFDFLRTLQLPLEQLRKDNKRANEVLDEVVRLFQRDGWHILPVVYFSSLEFPFELLEAAKRNLGEARQLLIGAMREWRDELRGYIQDRLQALGLEEEAFRARWAGIESQFTLALDGTHVEGVAGFMIAEAEGVFNTVTGPLGLEKGCFYTLDREKITHRKAVLDGLHQKLKPSDLVFDEDFTRRDLKRFTKVRSEVIPKRNQMQHGELGYRTQEHALWATSFLILTLEYLGALRRVAAG